MEQEYGYSVDKHIGDFEKRIFGGEKNAVSAEKALQARAEGQKRFDRKNYILYLADTVKSGRLYALYRRTGRLFYPLSLFYRIFRWGFRILTFIETSAFLLAVLILALALLPFFLVLFAAFLYGNTAADRRAARRILHWIGEREVVFSFYGESGSAELLPANREIFLLTVCEFPAPAGVRRRFFVPMYRLGEKKCAIRESLYFLLRPLLKNQIRGYVY